MNSASYNEGTTATPKQGSHENRGDAQKSTDRHPCTYVLIAVIVLLLIFPIITIPILFTMYRGKQSTSSYTTVKRFHSQNSIS